MHYSSLQEYFSWEEKRLELLRQSWLHLELKISKLFLSFSKKWDLDYSVTREVDSLEIDEFWIIGDRHRTVGNHFRPRLREGYIYPKGMNIKSERHMLWISTWMCEHISEKMWITISPELLWANILFETKEGNSFYFDGLPLGTDFMVYDSCANNIEEKQLFVANFKLVTFQMWCGITGTSIANAYHNKEQTLNFVHNSELFRWIILCLHWPQLWVILYPWQKVFLGLPTWYIH
jgi:hypothetical protein